MTKNIEIINTWFKREWTCGLVLPDGWFGRPYDNQHCLTEVSDEDCRLHLILDKRLHLTFLGDVMINDKGLELEVAFDKCLFNWQEYGSTIKHSKIYEHGVVKLLSFVPVKI